MKSTMTSATSEAVSRFECPRCGAPAGAACFILSDRALRKRSACRERMQALYSSRAKGEDDRAERYADRCLAAGDLWPVLCQFGSYSVSTTSVGDNVRVDVSVHGGERRFYSATARTQAEASKQILAELALEGLAK